MQPQNEILNLEELKPIMRYIEVLISEYPNTLSSKELAEKAGVSRAAVSKQKRRIRSLCKIDELVYNTRMVLKSDFGTFAKIAVSFLFQGKPAKFLSSPYTIGMIGRIKVHDEISKSIEEYSRHFTEQDTENMILIALRSLGNLKLLNEIPTKVSDPHQRAILLSFQYAQALEDFLNDLDLPLDNNKDLELILTLRDKLFYLAKDVCRRLVRNASILTSLSDDEKKRYLEVYFKTIDFYLRKFFDSGTGRIKQIAEKKEILFKSAYAKVGCFYRA